MNKLIIGVPNGSLIDSERGGLKELLDKAGIEIDNIGTNKPLKVRNIPWLEAREGRPQELPALAKMGYCDAFFCGDDWAREWELRGIKSEKVLGLGIGKVDLVYAKRDCAEDTLKLATEYSSIAMDYLPNASFWKLGKQFPVDTDLEKEESLLIIPSLGKTEAKAYYGLVDSVIEAVNTGDTLANYGMVVVDKVMSSECSLYCKEESALGEKIDKIKKMLEGGLK